MEVICLSLTSLRNAIVRNIQLPLAKMADLHASSDELGTVKMSL